MFTLNIKIPNHLAAKKQGLLLRMATNLYEQEILSLKEAADMAEITVDDFGGRYSLFLHDRFEEPSTEYITKAPSKKLSIKEELEKKKDQIDKLCHENSVKTLYIFGSALRDDFDVENSDLDFVYTFLEDPKDKNHADRFFYLLYGLEDIFLRKIDLISYRAITNEIMVKEINETKKLIYESK